jgi:terminase small subunit / prophage DNA-packing protein
LLHALTNGLLDGTLKPARPVGPLASLLAVLCGRHNLGGSWSSPAYGAGDAPALDINLGNENMFKVNVPMGKNEMETVSASELAALLLVSRKTIAEWAALGVVVRVGHGRYDLRESVKGFAKHMRERDRGGDVAAVASVATERAGLLAVQRKRAEHEFERELSKWIPADEVTRQWTHRFSGIKAQIMALSSRFPYLDHMTVARIDEEAREFLNEIADGKYDVKELAP